MNSGKSLTIVLRYGSFDPTKMRAEALARVGELGLHSTPLAQKKFWKLRAM